MNDFLPVMLTVFMSEGPRRIGKMGAGWQGNRALGCSSFNGPCPLFVIVTVEDNDNARVIG